MQQFMPRTQMGAPAPAYNPSAQMAQLAQMGNFGQQDPTPVETSVKKTESLLGENNPALEALRNTPPAAEGLGGFFGNMDSALQSPSKVLGMGLLSQINPYLGVVGLLGSGLFGDKKVF
jgi:hypothetical protein